jgi:hypothetical protein
MNYENADYARSSLRMGMICNQTGENDNTCRASLRGVLNLIQEAIQCIDYQHIA